MGGFRIRNIRTWDLSCFLEDIGRNVDQWNGLNRKLGIDHDLTIINEGFNPWIAD
jgi:hypothetical protein